MVGGGTMSWPVFVINMAGDGTRMDRAASELERVGVSFSRFEAVNGRALDEAETARVYDPKANLRRARHPMIGPELGCYLSHVTLWEQIAASDAEGGIILEDDFAAADDFAQVLKAIETDSGNWEIAKLFSARVGQKLLDERPLVDGRVIAVPYKVPNTTLGYAIRREAAARLAAHALPVSRPIDEDHKHFWERNLKVVMVAPPPLSFSQDSTDDGSITATRRKAGLSGQNGIWAQAKRTLGFRLSYLFNLHWNRVIRRIR